MTRREINTLIKFAVRIRERVESIRTNLYSSQVEFDEDYIVTTMMAMDHLLDTINGLTRMIDENGPQQTLEDLEDYYDDPEGVA